MRIGFFDSLIKRWKLICSEPYQKIKPRNKTKEIRMSKIDKIREELEELEEQTLAAYATKVKNTRGRKIAAKKHPYRTEFQRDRDRIIYNSAFRRLEEKTQVFYDLHANYFRTRLTHTIGVAQTARVTAIALKLNPDLAEAIALAHDIGHPPFGHLGEELLKKLVLENADSDEKVGFEHNLQGLRIVDFLEERYPDFFGLNLTFEVRRGIAKYELYYAGEEEKFRELFAVPKTLEAVLVDICDRISYLAHDLEDGLIAGFITHKLIAHQPLIQIVVEKTGFDYASLPQELGFYLLCRDFKNYLVSEFLRESAKRLESWKPDSAREPQYYLAFPETLDKQVDEFYEFLYDHFYMEPAFKDVIRENSKVMKELFYYYLDNPQMLNSDKHSRPLVRRVCDYLASLTDRSIIQLHKTTFGNR